ncbi:hypothetical protein PRIPAC_85472 [Pristionchus pacificus]|uniref:Uncharacterized protein n=1 Tax=Pristionchus pacificus TaxID=54126 RepID=A0A2A6C4X0_PRIPA|nr:hypothetical protein PRIPAC_85472 [Pristionchus pacificus]|eukprot:PDM73214.1 hypothetical protein PRIPAC_43310 [Pristionchus pacificus]
MDPLREEKEKREREMERRNQVEMMRMEEYDDDDDRSEDGERVCRCIERKRRRKNGERQENGMDQPLNLYPTTNND